MAKSKTQIKKYHRHHLYEAAVQSADHSLDFMQRAYHRFHDADFKILREDFCGTAMLCCEWVKRGIDNRAIGLDLDRKTLDWGRQHHRAQLLPEQQQRVELRREDVLTGRPAPADVICAFNFSYFIFKARPQLAAYLTNVCRGLKPGGLFVADIFGGTESQGDIKEKRKVLRERHPDGTVTPGFNYTWEQRHFNPVNNHLDCRIHFRMHDGSKKKNAFRYDWRLWTLPEMNDLLEETGFTDITVYTHGWTDEGESDDVFRPRKQFKNEEGWLAYIVAQKP